MRQLSQTIDSTILYKVKSVNIRMSLFFYVINSNLNTRLYDMLGHNLQTNSKPTNEIP